jgi:NHLM bacteriocin system ABC transporter peptidase/ATP-binding protein
MSRPDAWRRWTTLERLARCRRLPTVLQMEAAECGAASLAMVLAYHGRFVSLDELRTACGISRDGSKASTLLAAARAHGMIATGYKREPHELEALGLPLIVHWQFNHFVVLEGLTVKRALLNDPASGPRRITRAEFDEGFTGVALAFKPGPEFRKAGSARRWSVLLARRVAGAGPGITLAAASGLLLVAPGLVVPTFSRIFVDDVLVNGLTQWLQPLAAAMIATAVILGLLTWLQRKYLLRLETRIALSSSAQFFWHLLHLPIGFYSQRYAGEIGSRVALNDRVAQLLSGELATTLLGVALVIFYGALMTQYDAILAAIGIAGAVIDLAVLQWVAKRRTDLSRQLLRDQGRVTGTAMGGLQSIETLKAMGAESDFFARWSGQQARLMEAQQQLRVHTELLSALPPLVLSLTVALLLTIGAFRVMDGRMTVGSIVAFQALLLAFIAPVGRLFDFGGALQEVQGHLDRLEDVMNVKTDASRAAPAGAPLEPVRLRGHVEIRNIVFSYSPLEAPLIDAFSLTLRPGSRVALVGGSGSGKTTVAKLVAGLFAPASGEVLFDERPRAHLRADTLTSSFAVVDQEIFLFEGTVKENLSLWDPTVPDAHIVRAAADACIHDEIAARPGGYASAVQEGGRNFSGGQRQRLEIARALVNNPTILVLDEATSALDPVTEKQIDDNLRRRGCTCLLVAHRLSTIRDCDEIVVLERGRVVQRGTHHELSASPGVYRNLISAE